MCALRTHISKILYIYIYIRLMLTIYFRKNLMKNLKNYQNNELFFIFNKKILK